jgi:type II secretory pathway predicted ATPase ExeA
MIDKMQQHFGFTQMPFGRDLAPAMLHRHAAHAEAAARITWTITEKTLGVITGETGFTFRHAFEQISSDSVVYE